MYNVIAFKYTIRKQVTYMTANIANEIPINIF